MNCLRRYVMKRLLFLCITLAVLGTCKAQYNYFIDPNSAEERYNDYQFNNRRDVVLDGVYIKNGIGIDWHQVQRADTSMYPVRYPCWIRGIGSRNDSLFLECRPSETKEKYVMIGGTKCRYLTFYHYMKENYKLVSLEDIRREYMPDYKGKVVYMINKFLIMNDADLYKLDDSFIQHIEYVDSKDIDALKNSEPFKIVRIFTRSLHNRMTGFLNMYDD